MTSDVCNCPRICHHNDNELTILTNIELNHVNTDRSKKNSKWMRERIEYSIMELREFGIEISIKSKFPRYEIYQECQKQNGKDLIISKSVFMLDCNTLEDVWMRLGAINNFKRSAYIFENSSEKIHTDYENKSILEAAN